MRVGDFSVEVVPHREGRVRELDSGHVLSRPGQVYRLRLRNHGPLRAVVQIEIDGRSVTDSGLVLRPWSVTELERPLRDGEHGRFTVIAEGNERAFGPDGGRDNESLGVICAAFRRELPQLPSQDDLSDEDYLVPEADSPASRVGAAASAVEILAGVVAASEPGRRGGTDIAARPSPGAASASRRAGHRRRSGHGIERPLGAGVRADSPRTAGVGGDCHHAAYRHR